MTTTLRTLLFLALIVTHASAQGGVANFESGTVIVVEHAKDEVIVATDSRIVDEKKVARDTCKIKTYKNIGVFAASGSVHYGRKPDGKSWWWDANRTALEAIQIAHNEKRKEDKATQAATIWDDRGKEFFQKLLSAANSQEFIRRIQSNNDFGQIVEGIFALNESGTLSVVHAGLFLRKEATGTYIIDKRIDPPSSVDTVLTMGYGIIPREFLKKPPSAWATAEYFKWKASLPKGLTELQTEELYIGQLVQWTIDSNVSYKVGGDVNELVLGEHDIHWIKQKEYCKGS